MTNIVLFVSALLLMSCGEPDSQENSNPLPLVPVDSPEVDTVVYEIDDYSYPDDFRFTFPDPALACENVTEESDIARTHFSVSQCKRYFRFSDVIEYRDSSYQTTTSLFSIVDITPVDEPDSEGITRFHCERIGWLRRINYTAGEEKEGDGEKFKFDVKLNADGSSFSIQSYEFSEDRYGGHFELTGDYPAVPIAINTIIE